MNCSSAFHEIEDCTSQSKELGMNKVINALNNRYLIAAMVGLFVLGFARRFVGR